MTTAEGDKITVYPAPGRRTEEAAALLARFVAEGMGATAEKVGETGQKGSKAKRTGEGTELRVRS